MWGCISASRLGHLIFIDGIMNCSHHLNTLRENLKFSTQTLDKGNNFIFYHENDSKHTALNVRLWCINNYPQVLKTPSQSPDLNPVEQIWRKLVVRVRKHDIGMKSKKKTAMMEEWVNIDTENTK